MNWRLDTLLTEIQEPENIRTAVWIGTGLLGAALCVLMRTRWGQNRPLRKCFLLSLMAHVLAASYSTTVQLNRMVAEGSRRSMAVIELDQITDFTERPAGETLDPAQQKTWEKFAEPTTPTEVEPLERAVAESPAAPTRSRTDDMLAVAGEPRLPAAESTQMVLPRPEEELPHEPLSPSTVAESTAELDAPEAKRRDAPKVPTPDNPTLHPDRALASEAPAPRRAVAKDRLPQSLLEAPSLPPQMDGVEVAEPQPAAPGTTDEPRRQVAGGAEAAPIDGQEPSDTASMTGDENAATRSARMAATGGTGSDIGDLLAAAGADAASAAAATVQLGTRTRPTSDEATEVNEVYGARLSPDRAAITAEHGGTELTEGAVQAALAWLASAQSEDGRWDAARFGAGQEGKVQGRDRKGAGADGDNAVTGLALLAFLGAGHTHQDGPYQAHVRRGLEFLISTQTREGFLSGGAGTYAAMYCHGMAAFALCEAYSLTHDPELEGPVRKAVNYTLRAQHPSSGGWRYKPGDPQGDTSQLGWQLMALKSADLAGLNLPERSREGMLKFLKSVASGPQGGLASYRAGEKTTRTMTAEALVCRQFLGAGRRSPASLEAGDYLLQELPGSGNANHYYWYYGTLAMYHLGGTHWDRWNRALKSELLETQQTAGDLAGSWDPDPLWGQHGGRVYSTALSALCLEVYYRYLPLYSQSPELPLRR